MESGEPASKNRVLEFAETHPHLLLAAVGVLCVLLLSMYLYNNGWFGSKQGFKKKKNEPLDDDEEMDTLIDSIHTAQGKK
jgi:hypothetical protein